MPSSIVTSLASPVSSAISTGVSSISESPISSYVNGHHPSAKSETFRNRRQPTFAKANDVFPKKRRTLSSLDGLKPHFGAKADPEAKPKKFPRISKPVELLNHTYDVVVIGSGYGGSVAASRMARARQSVCVLELGREQWRECFPLHIQSRPWLTFDQRESTRRAWRKRGANCISRGTSFPLTLALAQYLKGILRTFTI